MCSGIIRVTVEPVSLDIHHFFSEKPSKVYLIVTLKHSVANHICPAVRQDTGVLFLPFSRCILYIWVIVE